MRRLKSRRGDVTLLAGQIARIATQGLYFIILARGLGASGYGNAAAVLALISMTLPFSGLGATLILMRNVAQRPTGRAVQWANATFLIVASGSLLTVVIALLAQWFVPVGVAPLVVLAVGTADLVLGRLVESAAWLFQAQERMLQSALFPVLLQGARLLGLVPLLAGTVPFTVGNWALMYLLSSVPAAFILCTLAFLNAGLSLPRLSIIRAEFRRGLLFTMGLSSTTIYNDMDKVLLGRLSTAESVGVYSAAYRIVDMSFAPIRALIGAASPAMWRAGFEGSVYDVAKVARRRVVKPALAYSTLASVVMLSGAGLLPIVLGPSFEESSSALRGLAAILILKTVHYIAGDILTCGGQQAVRTVIQLSVAGLNVALCLWLIPIYGWQGAVIASVGSDGLLAAAACSILYVGIRRDRTRESRRDLRAETAAHLDQSSAPPRSR